MADMTYIKVFVDYLDAIEPLGDAERGRLFTALLEYARTGEAPQLGGNERFLFPMMRAQIDRDNATMTGLSEARSRAGRSGAEAKRAKAKQNKQLPDLQSKPSYDKEKDEDKEKDNDKDEDEKTRGARVSPPTLEEVETFARERGKPELANDFFTFYSTGNWTDTHGNPVLNWKQKFLTWGNFEPQGRGRRRQPQTQPGPNTCQPSAEAIARSNAWLHEFLKSQGQLDEEDE